MIHSSPSACLLSSLFRIPSTTLSLYFQTLFTPLRPLLRGIRNHLRSLGRVIYGLAALVRTKSVPFIFLRKRVFNLNSFPRITRSQVRHFALKCHISTHMILKIKMIDFAGSTITQSQGCSTHGPWGPHVAQDGCECGPKQNRRFT